MDFVHDQLATGSKLRILAVVDLFSRFSPVIDPRFSYRGEDVVATLERVCAEVGYPGSMQHRDAAELHQLAIEQRHGLGRHSVDVHADNPHNLLLGLTTVEGAGGQHDNYGSALAAHPG